MLTIQLSTTAALVATDVTPLVVDRAYPDGLLLVSTPHSTAGLALTEDDPDLLADLVRVAAELLVPLEPFTHHRDNNPNAAAHVFSALLGTQLLLPATAGRVALGTYQRIVFVELDGPRQRQLQLTSLAVVADLTGEAP